MIRNRLRAFFSGGPTGISAETKPDPSADRAKSGAFQQPRPLVLTSKAGQGETTSRHSNGLDQFFGSIHDQAGLSLLDLSGASQANISYITSLGHKLYSEDFLTVLSTEFGEGDFYANQSDPTRNDEFLKHTLDFPDGYFQGALVWDSLQYLASPLLEKTVRRLHAILSPGAYMLAFFQADDKSRSHPLHSYRIADGKNLLLAPRGQRGAVTYFNNRAIEKLFQDFDSVKFFLTRDHLREVIVRK